MDKSCLAIDFRAGLALLQSAAIHQTACRGYRCAQPPATLCQPSGLVGPSARPNRFRIPTVLAPPSPHPTGSLGDKSLGARRGRTPTDTDKQGQAVRRDGRVVRHPFQLRFSSLFFRQRHKLALKECQSDLLERAFFIPHPWINPGWQLFSAPVWHSSRVPPFIKPPAGGIAALNPRLRSANPPGWLAPSRVQIAPAFPPSSPPIPASQRGPCRGKSFFSGR